ncbi:hypothetical protein OCU04_010927 [Sclerotinia nivalis]|uniref:Uncharacterized protein n=1 Tax=Sclerotinia nivalis TaxID=352851 RepID=A0A9X0DGA6_9HELO|nr:hypothetical protein OCU04_010927 [Sclerotinia nivalis]
MILPKAIAARAWTPFFLGSGIAFFTALAGVGTKLATASCSSAMWLALFGVPAATGPVSACIAAGAIAVLSSSVAAGLAAYGYSAGWTFEGDGAAIGKRGSYARIINPKFGTAHVFDADNTLALNLTYGGMLESHNTTLVAVTWIETLEGANYTNSPLVGLNMTQGRLVTLNDNGVIRTALGGVETLPRILDGFADFKNNVTRVQKRQSEEVDWLSFNTYGENMEEGGVYIEGLDEDANASKTSADYGVDGWAESYDYYASSMCLGASPPNDGQGVDSIIVGEVYMNAYGGIDTICQSG